MKIEEIFYLSVYINGNGDNNNGFNIANMPIQVQIGYDVQKTIHQLIAEDNTIEPIAGDSAAGEPGKTVVYKIVAQNKVSSTDPIKNAIIKDTLPDGLFDLSTVEVCDEYGKWASVEVNDDRSFTVGTVPNFEPGQKKEYYVKATIFEGEYEPSDAVYINTASLSGENAPIEKKDTANIIIGSPKGTADLTISKTVVGTNDARLIANSEFTFTIRSIVEGVYTTEFYDSLTATSPTKNTKQLDIGNSFKLKDGQRLVIKDLPVGSTVRIEEEQHPNFICTNRNQQCVILTSIETTKNSLTFVNNFTTDPIPPDPPDETETADLTITKSGAQGIDENQSFVFEVTGPGGYRQTVIIHGNGKAVIKDLPDGTYTVKEKKDWSWRYTPVQESVTLNFPEQSEAAFTNTRMNPGKWLNSGSYADNQWPTEPTAPAQ